MDTRKTALERAFELARSGECINLPALIKRLDNEGYSGNQIEGPQLKKQLAGLIERATNARSEQP
jgi:hypothetical protein